MLYGQKIRPNFQINATALTASGADQAKLLYQNLGFVPTKPRLNPAQAAAAPGLHGSAAGIGQHDRHPAVRVWLMHHPARIGAFGFLTTRDAHHIKVVLGIRPLGQGQDD